MRKLNQIALVALAALFLFSATAVAQRKARPEPKPKFFASCEECNETLKKGPGYYSIYEPTIFNPTPLPSTQYDRPLEADQCHWIKTGLGWKIAIARKGTVFFFDKATNGMERRKDCGNGAGPCPAPKDESLPPPVTGSIVAKKEAFDPQNNPLTRVPQFKFTLDGGSPQVNADNGEVRWDNLSSGEHVVAEVPRDDYEPLSPIEQRVQVIPGQTVMVYFKNRQVLPEPKKPKEEPKQPIVACPVSVDADASASLGQRLFGKPWKFLLVTGGSAAAGYALDNDGSRWDGAAWSGGIAGGANRGINIAKAEENNAKVKIRYIDGRPGKPWEVKLKRGETKSLNIREYPTARVEFSKDGQLQTLGLPEECSDSDKARGAPWWVTPFVLPDRGGNPAIKPAVTNLGGGINP